MLDTTLLDMLFPGKQVERTNAAAVDSGGCGILVLFAIYVFTES